MSKFAQPLTSPLITSSKPPSTGKITTVLPFRERRIDNNRNDNRLAPNKLDKHC